MSKAKQSDTPNSEIDFSTLDQVSEDDVTANRNKGGSNSVLSVSIVNTASNGVRMSLTKSLMQQLGNPKEIQIATDKCFLYVGQIIPGSTLKFHFSRGKGINIIYNKGLVSYLTNKFDLDFSKQTSISFHDIRIEQKVLNDLEITYAVVRMEEN